MFAFPHSQASSAAATASPASSYQGEGSSPAASPVSPGRNKRRIAHEERELSEIKRRMCGLRVHCEGEASLSLGPGALGPVLEGVEEEAAAGGAEAMDSDASDDAAVGEEGEEEEDGMPIVRSDSQESASSSNSGGSGGGRIGGDDRRVLMLSALYRRRREPPKDKVEAKIESLIRASLRR